LPLPFTFNVSDIGLKPYAATPAPEKLLSELLQLGNFSGTGALLCDLGALCAFAAAALTPISLHGGLQLGSKEFGRQSKR
jgi:hypothetical protein